MPERTQLTNNQLTNESQEVISQCKVVVYEWSVNRITLNSGIDSELTKTRAIDVSSRILSATYSKTMGGPTGTFNFTLANSADFRSGDWKDIIRPGYWCVIYMSQDGDLVTSSKVGPPNPNAKKIEEAKKIRCIGFIDRVSVNAQINEKGAFDVVYEVSGRDFGVVYEDTSIWHNTFKFDRIVLEAFGNTGLNINGTTSIDAAMRLIHNLFYDPKAVAGMKVNDTGSLLTTALQWLMPRQMLRDVGLRVDKSPFWGELSSQVLNLSKTAANIAIEKPTDYLSGNAWEVLKKLSVPTFHELFTETTERGIPQLVFRPIPFAINKRRYRGVGQFITLYKDLPLTVIPSVDVVDFNIGEDNYARYNAFLTTVSTSLINVEDNINPLDRAGFPRLVQDSIKRYGFRPMFSTIDSIVKNAERSNGRADINKLVEFNWVLEDYWNNAVFAESGELNMVGRNFIKIGTAVGFSENTPYVFGKRYYVEGYTDTFAVDEKGVAYWEQAVMLTRGFEERDLRVGTQFSRRNQAFNREGEFTPSSSGGN